VGGSLQPIRIFIIICVPLMLMYSVRNKKFRQLHKYESYFFMLWWIYATMSLLWAIEVDESIKHIFYFAVNFLGFFVILWLADRANEPQQSVVNGWILAFILTIPIAFYELWFDVHLSLSKQESDNLMNFGGMILQRRFASVTFYNLNGYNTFLCYILPFIASTFFIAQKSFKMAINWILLLLLCYLIISNSSRGAVFCLVVGLSVFMFYYLKKGKLIFISLVLIFIVTRYTALLYFEEIFEIISVRLKISGLEDVGRYENITMGLKAVVDSNLFGIGVGNYIPYMERLGLGISIPHNLFIEIVAQYGVFIFIGFLFILFRIIQSIRKNQSIFNKVIISIGLFTYPFVNIINSGYLLTASTWLYLASLCIIANKYYNKESIYG